MDLTRLTQGEKIAGVSGIALILIMFIFKWFGVKVSGRRGCPARRRVAERLGRRTGSSTSSCSSPWWPRSAWRRSRPRRPRSGLPVAASAIVAGLGILSVVLIIISIISPPDFGADLSAYRHRPHPQDRRLARADRRDRRRLRWLARDAGGGDLASATRPTASAVRPARGRAPVRLPRLLHRLRRRARPRRSQLRDARVPGGEVQRRRPPRGGRR